MAGLDVGGAAGSAAAHDKVADMAIAVIASVADREREDRMVFS